MWKMFKSHVENDIWRTQVIDFFFLIQRPAPLKPQTQKPLCDSSEPLTQTASGCEVFVLVNLKHRFFFFRSCNSFYFFPPRLPKQKSINCTYCNDHEVTIVTVCEGWFVGLGLEFTRVHMSRSSTLGSSTTDLILRRKVTASLPSIKRWSYVRATYIMGRIST